MTYREQIRKYEETDPLEYVFGEFGVPIKSSWATRIRMRYAKHVLLNLPFCKDKDYFIQYPHRSIDSEVEEGSYPYECVYIMSSKNSLKISDDHYIYEDDELFEDYGDNINLECFRFFKDYPYPLKELFDYYPRKITELRVRYSTDSRKEEILEVFGDRVKFIHYPELPEGDVIITILHDYTKEIDNPRTFREVLMGYTPRTNGEEIARDHLLKLPASSSPSPSFDVKGIEENQIDSKITILPPNVTIDLLVGRFLEKIYKRKIWKHQA